MTAQIFRNPANPDQSTLALDLEDAARIVGVSPDQLERYLQGSNMVVSLDDLHEFAAAIKAAR